MVLVNAPNEELPDFNYVFNPVAIFDGLDALLGYFGPTRQVTVVRFADVISLKVLPINSEYLHRYTYPIKHFVFNEIVGSDETKEWEDVNARLWAIPFNDVTVEVMFMGPVTLDGVEAANQTLASMLRR